MSFVFAFFPKSSSFCVRFRLLRISSISAGKAIPKGPPYQSWKCRPSSMIISRSSSVITIFRIEMDWIMPNLGVNEFWREGRKLLDRSLRPSALMSYRQVMQEKTRWLLAQLLANPSDFHHHIELLLSHLFYIVRLLTTGQPSGKTDHVTRIWLRPKRW